MLNIANQKVIILAPQTQAQIVIIDYGMGNLGSIKNMLKAVGSDATITGDIAQIRQARKLILPGVGAFDNGMANIKKMKLLPVLNELVLRKKIPILGICLGMQLMTQKSEEGKLPGLGWLKAETKKFRFDNGLKIPHMGWNNIKVIKKHALARGLNSLSRFYFVHSYHVVCAEPQDILFETRYGYPFVSAFQKGNIIGVQFHPEKSHKYGLQLLSNFAKEV